MLRNRSRTLQGTPELLLRGYLSLIATDCRDESTLIPSDCPVWFAIYHRPQPMLMSLLEQVTDSETQHERLLRDLDLLADRPTTLARNKERLEERRLQAIAAEKELITLRQATKQGREEYVNRRNSSLKKLGSKLTGKEEKYNERVSEDEQ